MDKCGWKSHGKMRRRIDVSIPAGATLSSGCPLKSLCSLFICIREIDSPYYGRKTQQRKDVLIMNVIVKKVAQIAVGVFVGCVASDAANGMTKKIKKVVKAKQQKKAEA